MKKQSAALLLTLALALPLGGCASQPAEEGPKEEVTAERVVQYGLSNPWDSLMPYNSPSGSNYSRIIYDKIYDRLAYVHADGTVTARAAQSWESVEDGYGIVFHLNPDCAFHDGTPVTAEHWVETIALLTDENCPALGRSAFSVLTGTDENGVATGTEELGVKAVDEHTLQFTFKTPTIPEEFLLDKNREYYVLPTHLLEGVDPAELMEQDLWAAPVGSGPCEFVSEVTGNSLTLKANEDYQLGAPGFDTLVITVMDKSSLLTALIAGDLDYYAFGGSVSADNAPTATEAGFTVSESEAPNTFYELMLNCQTLSDARIRRAVEYALDKELLCEQSTGGYGEVTSTSILPTCESYPGPGETTRNVELSMDLLEEAGYDGETYTLACTSNRSGLAALMQQQLAEAGIQTTIETVDSATLFSGMSDGLYDMAIASHTPSALPLWFVESRFSAENNIFHVDDLSPYLTGIDAIRTETDQEARKALVAQLDGLLAEERPFIPLWFGTALHVESNTVTGIDYDSSSFSNENVWEWEKQ